MGKNASEEPSESVATAGRGPVLDLPTEFPPERLDALCNVLARVLAARALRAMQEEPANENC